MTPQRSPVPYADVVDEWSRWQRQTNKPMSLGEYARFMDQREGAPLRQSAYGDRPLGQALQGALLPWMSPDAGGDLGTVAQKYSTGVDQALSVAGLRRLAPFGHLQGPLAEASEGNRLSELTGAMGAVAEPMVNRGFDAVSDLVVRPVPIDQSGPLSPLQEQAVAQDEASPSELFTSGTLEQIGRGVPRMAMQSAGMLSPWTAPLAMADASASAYTPHADPVSAVIAPATMAAAPGVMGLGGRIGENVVGKALFPSVDDLVAQPSRQYGRSVAEMFKLAENEAAKGALLGGNLAGQVAAGTGLAETGRQAHSLATTGELAPVSASNLAADVVSNVGFAPLMARNKGRIEQKMVDAAMYRTRQADAARMQRAAHSDKRGERIALTHKSIFDKAARGEDASGDIIELRKHWDEASGATFEEPDVGMKVLKAVEDLGNAGNLPDDSFHRVVAGVQGRFTDMFKSDPSGTPWETVNELVRRGYLPKLTKEWITENYSEAVRQMMGDEQGAKANLINRIVATYEERLPAALEAMRAAPVDTGLTRQQLTAQSEADKDATYINALLKLMPYMKDAKMPDGKTNLSDVIFGKDIEMSSATQGNQLQSESVAWAKYDAWKDAVIKLAETYDPATRRGMFLPSRRLADGTMLELPAQQISLEEMASPDFRVTPSRKYGRGGTSSALRDAVEYVSDKFGSESDEDDIRADPEKFVEERKKLLKGDDTDLMEDEAAVIEGEADEQGLQGEEREQFIRTQMEALENANAPAFGIDLEATNREDFYDLALFVMNRIDSMPNAELWERYGGRRLFGKGALSSGKFELFKDALLAKLESDMDDTGKLTAAQKRFYDNWRKNANKDETVSALPTGATWEEQRQQFRHALRLYWRQVSEFRDVFEPMLADKPQFMRLLKKGQAERSQESRVSPKVMNTPLTPEERTRLLELRNMDIPSMDPKTRKEFGTLLVREDAMRRKDPSQFAEPKVMSTAERMLAMMTSASELDMKSSMPDALDESLNEQGAFNFYTGFRAPTMDAVRLGRGFARKLGYDEEFADNFGVTLGKLVAAFEETAGVGKLVTDEKRVQGSNIASNLLQGPVVALNFEGIEKTAHHPVAALLRVMQTLAHELAHNYSGHHAPSSVFRQQRADAHAKLKALFEQLGPEPTIDLLNNIMPDILYPPGLAKMAKTSLLAGEFGDEAVSRLMEHVLVGAMTKDNPWQVKGMPKADTWGEAVKWLPDQIQAVMHLAMRDVGNYLGAIKDFYSQHPKSTDQNVPRYLDAMIAFANDFADTSTADWARNRMIAQSMLAKLQAGGSADWEDPTIVRSTLDLDNRAVETLAGKEKIAYSKIEDDTVREAQTMLFGTSKNDKVVLEHEKLLGTRIPAWSHWASLYYQALRRYQKAGVPLAETAMHLVNDLEPSYFRLTKLMHQPFLTTDAKGRLVYDMDHPVQKVLQGTDLKARQARQAINDLYRWANEKATPVVQRNPEGLLVVTPEANEVTRKAIGHMDPATQQGVLEGLSSLVQGYKEAANIAYHSQIDNSAARIAGVLMTVNKGMYWDNAFNTAKKAVVMSIPMQRAMTALKEAQEKEPLIVPQRQAELQQAQAQYGQAVAGLDYDQIGSIQKYMFGPEGMAQKLIDLGDFFQQRGDWFGSELRPGQIFIVSRMPDGKHHYTSAVNEREAQKVVKELSAKGHTTFRLVDQSQKDNYKMFQSPDAVVEDFIQLEQKAWKEFMHGLQDKFSTEDLAFIDSLGYAPGAASTKMVQSKAVERYMKHRELRPGRERLDAFEVFREYTGRLSGSVARRGLRQQIDLLLRDPRVRNDGEFKNTVLGSLESLMQPIDNRFVAARAAMTAYYLGLPNIVSPMIEAIQSVSTILPYLVDENGFNKAINLYRRSMVAPASMRNLGHDLDSKRLLQSAQQKESIDPRAMTKQEALAYYYKRASDEGTFVYGPIYDTNFSRDHQMLTQQAFGLGRSTAKTREQLITDPIYWASQKTMWLYSQMSGYNQRVAFLAGLETMYDKGFRGSELYQRAQAFKNVATFGGGKANTVGYVSKLANPTTRSAFSLIESLQRYTFGYTTMYKDLIADMLGRTKLDSRARMRATEALGTAALAQFLLAGALGIPGAAIGAAIIQKLTGYDAKQKLREFWNALYKGLLDDDELAVTLANVSQNGVVSNMLGVDVSNRLTTNQILGFNEYDGFNTSDLFGVGTSIIEGAIDGTKYVAQGDMVKAGRSIAPPSWRPYIDLAESKAKYGDLSIRDTRQRAQVQLTKPEAVAYGLGLRPMRYRHLRDQIQASKNSDEQYSQTKDSALDSAAQDLLRGNVQTTLDLVRQLQSTDPTQSSQTLVRSVLDRAVAATRPVDPLATGVLGNEDARLSIAESFGNAAPRQSEVDDLLTRERLNAQLGYLGGNPVGPQDLERAALVDALIQQRGMTRADAQRTVEMLFR